MKNTALIYLFTILWASVLAQKQVKTLQAPAENQKSVIYTEGVSILPSGRFVTPVGKVTRITINTTQLPRFWTIFLPKKPILTITKPY